MSTNTNRALSASGFLILEGFMSREFLRQARARVEELFDIEGAGTGSEFRQEPETRRLANLVNKGEVFRRMIVMPEILDYVSQVLGPRYKLSSLNARSANPNSRSAQPLHADNGAIADEKGYWVCNTVWMLDDFTAENGAIRVVPGSHRWGKLPQAPHPDELLVTGTAGTVIVMNAHLWHGGTANRTAAHRRALHAFYCRHDKPQQQYQKKLLSPEVQAALGPELRDLLALDDPLNDELSAAGSNQSGFLK